MILISMNNTTIQTTRKFPCWGHISHYISCVKYGFIESILDETCILHYSSNVKFSLNTVGWQATIYPGWLVGFPPVPFISNYKNAKKTNKYVGSCHEFKWNCNIVRANKNRRDLINQFHSSRWFFAPTAFSACQHVLAEVWRLTRQRRPFTSHSLV